MSVLKTVAGYAILKATAGSDINSAPHTHTHVRALMDEEFSIANRTHDAVSIWVIWMELSFSVPMVNET